MPTSVKHVMGNNYVETVSLRPQINKQEFIRCIPVRTLLANSIYSMFIPMPSITVS